MPISAHLLADRFAAAQADLTQLVATATANQLALVTPEEGWSVLFVAHHIALAFTTHSQWVWLIISGHDVAITKSQLDASNAQMADDASRLTRDEVLAVIQANGAQAETFLRSLSPQQLATSARVMLAGGRQMTAEQVISGIMLGHFAAHVPHIRAALAGTATSSQTAAVSRSAEEARAS